MRNLSISDSATQMPPNPSEFSAEFLDKVLIWSSRGTNSSQGDFAEIARIFGQDVELCLTTDWHERILGDLEKLRSELTEGIEDYGTWRSTRGFPNFEVYVAAREGSSKEIARLKKSVQGIEQLREVAKILAAQFPNISAFAHACGEFKSIYETISYRKWTSNIYRSASLNLSDIDLCLAWANVSGVCESTEQGIRLLQEGVSNYNACRLLSARAAELSTASYYSELGINVLDISRTQLEKADVRWKDFDLLIGVEPLDVKNSRKSFSSPEAYVEHCIPRFKQDRKSGADVSIVGVLSDYSPDAEKIVSGAVDCVILGQVNVREMRQLFVWMRQRFGNFLNLNGLWDTGFLPGWMFELPAAQYQQRHSVVVLIDTLLEKIKGSSTLSDADIPGWLLTMSSVASPKDANNHSTRRSEMLADIASLGHDVGIKRSSLFVYSMGVILEAMLNGDDCDVIAQTLRELIFVDRTFSSPLDLIDTQRYVVSLIDVLLSVANESMCQGIQFTAFQMSHPAILRGQRKNGSWMTLVAYCGGWIEDQLRVKCGSSPLFFGSHEVCPACSKLICNACGHCENSCGLVSQRQSKLRKEGRHWHKGYSDNESEEF